jgi:Partial alpha/beta-hydrolase lipase region
MSVPQSQDSESMSVAGNPGVTASAAHIPPDKTAVPLGRMESTAVSPHDCGAQPAVSDVESAPQNLLPGVRAHHSFAACIMYRVLSAVLSAIFLTVVMILAMLKTLPSVFWVLWSWIQYKDPDRLRPFYARERERKGIDVGKLTLDVTYYANRVGLDCEEFTVETEDGFILIVQHIFDKRPGAVDWRRFTS